MLCITLKQKLESFVELPAELSEYLVRSNVDQISRLKLREGRNERAFQDLFNLTQKSEPDTEIDVFFEGDFSKVHGIGRKMSEGRLEIRGNIGDCVGEEMTGGTIEVYGNSRDCTARGMSGGRIIVHGDAGDHLGSFCPGSMKGMTGGEVFVEGSVGEFCGHRMRRGTIVVGGDSGEYLGYEMLAGTIVACGEIRETIGLNMVRGTILVLGTSKFESMSHLAKAVQYEPAVIRMLLKYMRSQNLLPEHIEASASRFTRYLGDMAMGQRGEVLVVS